MANSQWAGHRRQDRLPSNWSELRAECFRIWGDICYVCGLPGADEVDHVEQGDRHILDNLRPVHGWRTPQRCHVRKSSAEGGRAKADKQGRRQRPRERHPGLKA